MRRHRYRRQGARRGEFATDSCGFADLVAFPFPLRAAVATVAAADANPRSLRHHRSNPRTRGSWLFDVKQLAGIHVEKKIRLSDVVRGRRSDEHPCAPWPRSVVAAGPIPESRYPWLRAGRAGLAPARPRRRHGPLLQLVAPRRQTPAACLVPRPSGEGRRRLGLVPSTALRPHGLWFRLRLRLVVVLQLRLRLRQQPWLRFRPPMVSLRAGRTAWGRLYALRASRLHVSVVLPRHTWFRLGLGLGLGLGLRLSVTLVCLWARRATGWWLHAFRSMLGGGSWLGLRLRLELRFRLRLSLLRLWA